MKSRDSFPDLFVYTLFAIVIIGFISTPIIRWHEASLIQKQLNLQCGTNYSKFDILISKDNLVQLCRIENQQLIIK